jgi:hypothetical protein
MLDKVKHVINRLRNPVVFGQFRHLLSTVGGVLTTKGFIAENDWIMYSGIGVAVLSLVLSATAKEKKTTE